MTHTKYDMAGAVESARKAVKRTNRPRYVVLTAIGYTIESKRPRTVKYMAWQVHQKTVRRIYANQTV